jgi:hypothetical protein
MAGIATGCATEPGVPERAGTEWSLKAKAPRTGNAKSPALVGKNGPIQLEALDLSSPRQSRNALADVAQCVSYGPVCLVLLATAPIALAAVYSRGDPYVERAQLLAEGVTQARLHEQLKKYFPTAEEAPDLPKLLVEIHYVSLSKMERYDARTSIYARSQYLPAEGVAWPEFNHIVTLRAGGTRATRSLDRSQYEADVADALSRLAAEIASAYGSRAAEGTHK